MIVMVINSGSSSLKYQVYDMDAGRTMAKGLCERIGIDGAIRHSAGDYEKKERISLPTHQRAIETVLAYLTDPDFGVLQDIREIGAVGHRIGHGGVYFSDSVLIDQGVKDAIRKTIPLAPLHNPAAIMGIEACEAVLGKHVPQTAVCDTAFHQTLPKYAYTYSIPYALCEKHNIRRYGFHGTSHKYVAQQAAAFMGKAQEELNLITCHLGNGSSLAAIQGGKSIDTTMGFTSLEGVIMGTRCGDTDPAITSLLVKEEGATAAEVEMMFYKESGLLGISGVSSDLRDIEQAAQGGNGRAQNALDVLCYQIKKYIGAYHAALGGADAIAYTAGIGENSCLVRRQSLAGLEKLGIVLDEGKNLAYSGGNARISAEGSAIQVLVIPTNEEWMIAQDTVRLVSGA